MTDDEGVIPLSRWRAALARARKGHRAEALISEPDAAQLVPRVPVQELYYAIAEVGIADAHELIALASPEQIQGLVDLDIWNKDQLDETRLEPWLDALVEAGPEELGRAIDGLDPETIALYVQRRARVYDLQLDGMPEEPEGNFYPTADRFFLLDVLVDGERGKSFERFIDWLYRADIERARRIIMTARWELASDMEEHAYRWRSGRMADLGYAEFYDALSVYHYLDPASVVVGEATAATAGAAAVLPVQLAAALDEHSLLGRALASLGDAAIVERMQGQLMTLLNRAMAADLIAPGDVDGARATMVRAVGYLDVGLEYLARGDAEPLGRAGLALQTIALERIFRVGVSLTIQLRALADALWKEGRVQLNGRVLVDPPLDGVVAALRLPRPLYPAMLDDAAAPPRPFRALAEIGRAAAALDEAARLGVFVWDRLGLDPREVARQTALAANPLSEVTFGALVRTLAARRLLDAAAPLAPAPLTHAELLALAAHVHDGHLTPAARALCDGLFAATDPSTARWLDRWLSDFRSVLVRAV